MLICIRSTDAIPIMYLFNFMSALGYPCSDFAAQPEHYVAFC